MSKQNPAQEVFLNLIADCVAVLNMQLKRESGEWIVDNDRALGAWQGALERGIATLRKYNHDINAADRYAAPPETVAAPPTIAWVSAPPDSDIRASLPRAMSSVGYTISSDGTSMHRFMSTNHAAEIPVYRPRHVEAESQPNIQQVPNEASFDAAQTLLERLTNSIMSREED